MAQGNRVRAIPSGRHTAGLTEDWGTVQRSKHFNTEFTEKKLKPQIFTEKSRVTWATSCVRSRTNSNFSVRICGLSFFSVNSVLKCLLAFSTARFRTDERRTIKPVPSRIKCDYPATEPRQSSPVVMAGASHHRLGNLQARLWAAFSGQPSAGHGVLPAAGLLPKTRPELVHGVLPRIVVVSRLLVPPGEPLLARMGRCGRPSSRGQPCADSGKARNCNRRCTPMGQRPSRWQGSSCGRGSR